MITVIFGCPECEKVNHIAGLRTTATGEWMVDCVCGESEELDVNVFPLPSSEVKETSA